MWAYCYKKEKKKQTNKVRKVIKFNIKFKGTD